MISALTKRTMGLSALLHLGFLTCVHAGSCNFLPSDQGWPTKSAWDALNATVHGRLIATIPAAHVCHDPTYDEAACTQLKKDWDGPQAQYKIQHRASYSRGLKRLTDLRLASLHPARSALPSSRTRPANPFTPRSKPCTLGNYASYSINVTGTKDVAAGIQFAKEKNVRLVVKNTGHEYVASCALRMCFADERQLFGKVDWEGRACLVDPQLAGYHGLGELSS